MKKIRTILILFLSMLGITGCNIGITGFSSRQLPVRFSFKRYDFGTIRWGYEGVTWLKVKNNGKDAIHFTTMKCSCIDLSEDQFDLKPGETKRLRIAFKAVGYSGNTIKRITFMMSTNGLGNLSDDVIVRMNSLIDPKTLDLEFTSPHPKISYSFKSHDFGQLRPGGSSSKRLMLSNRENRGYSVHFEKNLFVSPSTNDFSLPPLGTRTIDLVFSPLRLNHRINTLVSIVVRPENSKESFGEGLYATGEGYEESERDTEEKNNGVDPDIIDGSRKIVLLTEPGCKNCETAKTLVSEILIRNPEPAGVVEIPSPRNIALIHYLNRRLPGQAGAFPVIIIGDAVVSGKKALDKAGLETNISNYLVRTPDSSKLLKDFQASNPGKYVSEGISSLNIAGIILVGIVDGVNPCAFATIIFLISYLGYLKKRKTEIAVIGAVFTFSVFLVYFLIGLGIFKVLFGLSQYHLISRIIKYSAVILVALFAVLSIADAWKASRGEVSEMNLVLPGSLVKQIHRTIRENIKMRNLVISAFIMGSTVSLLELACTGQMYFPTIQAMVQMKSSACKGIFYLLIYCSAFILPLTLIFLATLSGLSSGKLQNIFKKHLVLLKVTMAVGFALLGIYMVFG